MKRSKIFLGVTTALLAIVGVAAAKAHRSLPVPTFYKPSGVCIPAITTACTKNATGVQCLYPGTTLPLYTSLTCLVKVKYNNQ